MFRLFLTLTLVTIVFTILNAMMLDGTAGIATARLSSDITSGKDTITVDKLEGFPKYGLIKIGNEYIEYGDTELDSFAGLDTGRGNFLYCVRAKKGTDPSAHKMGDTVYSAGAAAINDSVGFDIISVSTNFGILDIVKLPINFATHTLPKMLTWNYAFLNNEWGQYVRIILSALSAITMVWLAYQIVMSVASGGVGFFGRFGGGI